MTLTDFLTLLQTCPIIAIGFIVVMILVRNWHGISAYISLKLANTKYEYILNVAKGIWNRVDEDFRLELQEVITNHAKKCDYSHQCISKYMCIHHTFITTALAVCRSHIIRTDLCQHRISKKSCCHCNLWNCNRKCRE